MLNLIKGLKSKTRGIFTVLYLLPSSDRRWMTLSWVIYVGRGEVELSSRERVAWRGLMGHYLSVGSWQVVTTDT